MTSLQQRTYDDMDQVLDYEIVECEFEYRQFLYIHFRTMD